MNLWVSLQVIIDSVLFAGIFYILIKFYKNESLRKEDYQRIQELKELRISLNKLLKEAVEISSNLSDDIENKQTIVNEFFARIDREKQCILKSAEKLNNLSSGIKSSHAIPLSENSDDRYSEPLRLAKMGVSPEEISRKVNIPLGEIELLLSLRK